MSKASLPGRKLTPQVLAEYEKDPHYLEALRDLEEIYPTPAVDQSISNIPADWLEVLHGFEGKGPLLGGALRDLFNGRPVKDVDIFLPSEGSQRKNRNLIKKAFRSASIRIIPQRIETYKGFCSEKFPPPTELRLIAPLSGYAAIQNAESWVVIAGSGQTPYNIVFFDGARGDILKKDAESALRGGPIAKNILEVFDIGLCRIACDGRRIETTPAYDKDVADMTITVVRPNENTEEHLQRVTAKYPGWKVVRP